MAGRVNTSISVAGGISLAYTARVNGIIDKEMVTSALQKLAHDSRYAGRVQDALDDIERGIDR